ncbi:uncharacterized protein LOC103696981 [Phoenix dactylifera]|uniref:Uncharacterized protein LOC103696981 n=1 Tax=Phoenix dactylifera TaxID=42345 RepID=A0A8B8ZM39_PHODC|nr:uncharacterized protein LOC103696981 [Phoenix dactylifera]
MGGSLERDTFLIAAHVRDSSSSREISRIEAQCSDLQPLEPVDNRLTVRFINTIASGPTEVPSTSVNQAPQEAEAASKRQRMWDAISFLDADLRIIQTPHNDAVIVSLIIVNYGVKRILVDNASSLDVLFYDAFQQMKLRAEQLRKVNTPLVGFSGDFVPVESVIKLLITAREEPQSNTLRLDFLVVRVCSAYNAILGQPGLNAFRVVESTYYLLM